MHNNSKFAQDSAASRGLANCHRCHLLTPITDGHCPRCGASLHLRSPYSVQKTLALVCTALLFYIPANLLPIMTTRLLGDSAPSTIIGGVWLFLEHGSYFVASVIFIASVVIPMAKIIAIVWLCYNVKRPGKVDHYELTRLYRVTEFIGKWSMIDVFVVAILVALIQLGELMTIEPGLAASAFAAVVIFTMIAAHEFDVRLIWDKLEDS